MSDPSLREALLKRGWRQGSVVPAALHDRIRWADAGAEPPDDAQVVVLSQDCDVAAQSLEQEPVVEVVAGAAVAAVDANLVHAKNPRRLDLHVADGDSQKAVRLEMRWRGTIERAQLAKHETTARVRDDSLRDLVAWVTRRYERSAFPDAFNDRLRANKGLDRLRKILKKVPSMQPLGVFVALGGQESVELETDIPYRVGLRVVLAGTLEPGDAVWDQFEHDVYEPLLKELQQIPGVEIVDNQLVSESEISWRERRVLLRPLDLDDLSLRDEVSGDRPYER